MRRVFEVQAACAQALTHPPPRPRAWACLFIRHIELKVVGHASGAALAAALGGVQILLCRSEPQASLSIVNLYT